MVFLQYCKSCISIVYREAQECLFVPTHLNMHASMMLLLIYVLSLTRTAKAKHATVPD